MFNHFKNPELLSLFLSLNPSGKSCIGTADAITMSGPRTTSALSIPIVILELLNFVFIDLPVLQIFGNMISNE